MANVIRIFSIILTQKYVNLMTPTASIQVLHNVCSVDKDTMLIQVEDVCYYQQIVILQGQMECVLSVIKDIKL